MSVIVPVLVWWLAVSAVGWFAVPVAFQLFPTLPDRGVSLARSIGMLLAGYVFWLAAMVGVLPNSRAGAAAAVALLVGLGVWSAARHADEMLALLRRRWVLVVGYEVLFFVVFVLWAIYRAYVPNIESAGGEKYMEMAFLNAVVDSPSFPPLDPWLSGFAISYYYFGYVLAGMLVHLTGIVPTVAFNLVVPMTLAMTVVAAFGLGYNLTVLGRWGGRSSRVFTGAFSAVLLPIAGNLIGAVELGYLRGWGPRAAYQWLGIRDLSPDGVCGSVSPAFGLGAAAAAEGAGRLAGWVPSRFIWWWRGSRVIQDDCREVIHEFPFFSFMLGDVHPHVMALPYVLLVIGLALAVLAGGPDRIGGRRWWSPGWLVLPLIVGALGFLNAWDLPTFGALVVIAYALRSTAAPARLGTAALPDRIVVALGSIGLVIVAWRASPKLLALLRSVPPEAQPLSAQLLLALAIIAGGVALAYAVWSRAVAGDAFARRAVDVGEFAVWLVALAFAFYLPFYVGFSSQAVGIGVVDIHSRLPQWMVHFGLLWFLAVSLSLALWPRRRQRFRWPALAAMVASGAVAVAAVLAAAWTAALLGVTVLLTAALIDQLWRTSVASPSVDATEAVEGSSMAVETSDPSDARNDPVLEEEESGENSIGASRAVALTFAVLCVGFGLLLTLAVEFVFVRDLFGTRMNTVFKLFYQAWTLLAIGVALAPLAIWRRWPRSVALVWTVPAVALFAASLIYPVSAVITRTNAFDVERVTLDGLAWWEFSYADDLAAARWLRENTAPGSIILEAYGGAYEHNGRLSAASGRPTVLGWEGHEHQWRGTREEIDPRKGDIERMYTTDNREELGGLLDRYGVQYLIVSDLERSKFDLSASDLERLEDWFAPVFVAPSGQVTIYQIN